MSEATDMLDDDVLMNEWAERRDFLDWVEGMLYNIADGSQETAKWQHTLDEWADMRDILDLAEDQIFDMADQFRDMAETAEADALRTAIVEQRRAVSQAITKLAARSHVIWWCWKSFTDTRN